VPIKDYLNILDLVFRTASELKDFSMGFGCAESAQSVLHEKTNTFFKQMVKTMPAPGFRRLTLSRLVTRKKYLKDLLRTCRSTIEALNLDCISFTAIADDQGIDGFLREELKLKEVTLRCLNFTWSGMYFGEVNQRRFRCHELYARSPLDDEGWMQVVKGPDTDDTIILKADEGDDISHWLSEVDKYSEMGEMWTWERVRYRDY